MEKTENRSDFTKFEDNMFYNIKKRKYHIVFGGAVFLLLILTLTVRFTVIKHNDNDSMRSLEDAHWQVMDKIYAVNEKIETLILDLKKKEDEIGKTSY